MLPVFLPHYKHEAMLGSLPHQKQQPMDSTKHSKPHAPCSNASPRLKPGADTALSSLMLESRQFKKELLARKQCLENDAEPPHTSRNSCRNPPARLLLSNTKYYWVIRSHLQRARNHRPSEHVCTAHRAQLGSCHCAEACRGHLPPSMSRLVTQKTHCYWCAKPAVAAPPTLIIA
jgi:hypothetical protein